MEIKGTTEICVWSLSKAWKGFTGRSEASCCKRESVRASSRPCEKEEIQTPQETAVNRTSHGRHGRYKTIDGVQHKLCNGPLHASEGAWLPLRAFWTFKSGPRAGKPVSRCAACSRVDRGRDPNSGLVPVGPVYFIFYEIQARIGKAEACRRLGMSHNLWSRLENRVYERMEKQSVRNAIILLRELRANNEVRHRRSIKSGATMRGKEERKPTHRSHYYSQVDDHKAEIKRKRNSQPKAQ